MERAQQLDRSLCWGEISVLLTDNAGIRRINQAFLSSWRSTDVIAFRYDPLPGDDGALGGEIIVNVERALEEARRCPSRAAGRELALYLAHGCDHLAGGTDDDAASRAQMRRRELRWLKDAEHDGLLEGLVPDDR